MNPPGYPVKNNEDSFYETFSASEHIIQKRVAKCDPEILTNLLVLNKLRQTHDLVTLFQY